MTLPHSFPNWSISRSSVNDSARVMTVFNLLVWAQWFFWNQAWTQGASVSQGCSFVLLPFNIKELWKFLLQLPKMVCCHFFQMAFEKYFIMKDRHKLLTFFFLRNTYYVKQFTKIWHFSAHSFLPLSLLGLLVFVVCSYICFMWYRLYNHKSFICIGSQFPIA